MSTKSGTPQMHYSSKIADKFVVRLPDGLRDRINVAAEENHRSMNGEILARICGSLDFENKYEEMRQFNSLLLRQIEVLESAAQGSTL